MAQTQKKRQIAAQGYVVEARGGDHPMVILHDRRTHQEYNCPLKQNGLEATPGQFVTVFDDGKFHIGELPKDWR